MLYIPVGAGFNRASRRKDSSIPQRGFRVVSFGRKNLPFVAQYIAKQKQHHANGTPPSAGLENAAGGTKNRQGPVKMAKAPDPAEAGLKPVPNRGAGNEPTGRAARQALAGRPCATMPRHSRLPAAVSAAVPRASHPRFFPTSLAPLREVSSLPYSLAKRSRPRRGLGSPLRHSRQDAGVTVRLCAFALPFSSLFLSTEKAGYPPETEAIRRRWPFPLYDRGTEARRKRATGEVENEA